MPFINYFNRVGKTGEKCVTDDSQYRSGLPFSDFAFSEVDTRDLRAVACTIRGRDHRNFGEPNQDFVAAKVSQSGEWLICVVADGVGSTLNSELASRTAGEASLELLVGLPNGVDPMGEPWDHLRDYLSAEIIRKVDPDGRLNPSDVGASIAATTLEFLLIGLHNSTSPGRAVYVRLAGDGGLLRFSGKRSSDLVSSDFEPVFLPNDKTKVLCSEFEMGRHDLFIICTDGLLELADKRRTKILRSLLKLTGGAIRYQPNYLARLRELARDDVSFVIIGHR